MLKFFARTIDDILPANPLVLFKKDQRTKLAKMFDRGVSGFQEDASRGIGEYFRGKQYGSMLPPGAARREARGSRGMHRRATTRTVAAGIGGGLMAANYLDFNPFGATDLATSAASLAGHGVFGGSMLMGKGGLSKGLGMGYLGLAGLNSLRRGDNPGPM
jgi:hypothetical protein